MAISLSQTLQEAKRQSQRNSIVHDYPQPGPACIPMPEHFLSNTHQLPSPAYSLLHQSITDHKEAHHNAYTLPGHFSLPPPPPLRPVDRVPTEQPPQYEDQPPTISIRPDLLPPHSNPQALSRTQSTAFQNSSPTPPVRITCDTVYDSQSGLPLFNLVREAAHIPAFLSSKRPIVTIVRTSTNEVIGRVHFHSFLTTAIDLHIGNGTTTLTLEGWMHDRWGFESTSTTTESKQAMWFWSKDKVSGGARLEDSKKHGKLLARMKGDVLTFEMARLTRESYDEVLVSAVAMIEAAKRRRKGAEIVDLASAVGNVADGGSGPGPRR